MGKYFDPKNYPKQAVNKVTIAANIITLSGSTTNGHTANITINGVLNTTICTIASTSLTVAATNWCAANYNFYKVRGFLVSSSGAVITVLPAWGWDTVNRINATIATVTGTLTGTLTGTFEPDGSKAPTWEVTFTTSEGIINAPTRIKDDASLRIIVKSTCDCSFSFIGWPHILTTDNFFTVVGAEPFVIDRVSSLVNIVNDPLSDAFYELADADGEVITNEFGDEILVL